MARETLTDLFIKNLKPDGCKQVDYFDTKVAEFGLRLSPKGTKTFFLRYRYQGRAKRLTIGRYGVLTLSKARELAQDAKRELGHGNDPGLRRDRIKNRPGRDFAALVDDFIEHYAKLKTKPATWKETARLLRRDFVRHWSHRDPADITKTDVLDVLRNIAKQYPIAANHAFAAVRKLFNWSVEQDYLKVSPCVGLKLPADPRSRDRVLADAELRRIWRASVTMGYPFGHMIQLLILTGQRVREVGGLRWDELDVPSAVWTLPSERAKNGKLHTVPMSPAAIEVLSQIPLVDDSPYVFPGREGSVSGFAKRKKQLDSRAALKQPWQLRDLRRTVATGLAGLEIEPHVIEALLNHKSGKISGIAAVYNRHNYAQEKRRAVLAWENHISSLMTDAEQSAPSAPPNTPHSNSE